MRVLKIFGTSLVLLTEVGCQSRYFRTNLAGRTYPADYDRNGDGITDIQAIKAGFDPADPALASQDPDGDGLSNYWEFKLGFDPHNADSDNTKYNKKMGGNGTIDCDEDIVGDGIGVCWKLENKFKPAEANRSLTDADGDAYSDGEEFLAGTDPNDATKRPAGGTAGSDGKLPPVLTLKGTHSSYTTSLSIIGTMSHCAAGEKVLFTSSKTKPSSDDVSFIDCTTSADALVGTLASGPAGNRVMFVWRRIAAGVVDVPLSAGILYTNRATSGGLDIIPAGDKTLAVALVPPADAHYGTVKLLRFSELDCSTKTAASTGATEVAINPGDTLVTAGNLPLGSSYCFKVFWTDDKGSVITAHGGYDGTPPPAGAFSISGYETKTIKFSHTPPTSAKYEKLALRRFDSLTCADKLATEGAEVPMGMTATAYNDSNLALGSPYCYKVFWSDSLGNSTSTTVVYPGPPTGADLALLGMQKTGANTGSVDLRLTRPTPVPTQTTLVRYGDGTCTSAETPNVSLTSPIPAVYDKTDSVTGFKIYCYKATWSDDFGNSATDSVVAKLYPPVISIAPTTFTYTAPGAGTAVTANSAGTVTYTASSFSSIFTNPPASVTLTPLLGNGSGSVLAGSAATLAESDIPGLTYSTANGCGTSSETVFCTTANLSGTVTGTGYSLENTGILKWIYSKFDQGEYFVKTMGRLELDGTKYFSLPSAGVISVQTPDLGNEEVLFSDPGSITSGFSNISSWFMQSPSVAVLDGATPTTKRTLAITYPSFEGDYNHYLNRVTIDQGIPGSIATSSDFSDVSSPSTNMPGKLLHQISATSADTEYSSTVSNSSALHPKFIAFSSISESTGNYLQLTTVNDSGTFSPTRVRLSIPNATQPSDPKVSLTNSSLTQAFLDNDNKYRHGLAFSAKITPPPTTSGQYSIRISKIISDPDPTTTLTRSTFLDRSGYFVASANAAGTVFPESVLVKDLSSSAPHDLKITTGNESGTNIFYVGWRTPVAGDEKLYMGRVVADGDTPPTPAVIVDSDAISGMTRTSTWGRSSYGLAAGKSDDSTPIDLLGVIYSSDTNPSRCMFRAYKFDGNNSLVRVSTNPDNSIDDLISSNSGPINDCRFANLFWNQTAKKFMAVWAQGGSSSFGPTNYAEFTYNAGSNTVTKIKQVVVTADRAQKSSAKKIVCNMGSTYSASSTGLSTPKIAIVTIESIVTNDPNDYCSIQEADMSIDLYKPGI